MIFRRHFFALPLAAKSSGFGGIVAGQSREAWAQAEFEEAVFDVEVPPIPFPDPLGTYPAGTVRPTDAAVARARTFLDRAPRNGVPADVARFFVSEQFPTDLRQQTPPGQPWNQVIVDFFQAVQNVRAQHDMVPWCAAFVNWCIERVGLRGTRNALAQSFVQHPNYESGWRPAVGSVAVIGAYRKDNGDNTGLGHVAFVTQIEENRILGLGGNQTSRTGRMPEINEAWFPREGEGKRCLLAGGRCEQDQRTPVTNRVIGFVKL